MFKWEPKSESVLVDTIGVAKVFSVKIFLRRPSTWKMLSGKSRATVFVVSLTLASIKFFCWLIFIVDFCFVQSQFLPPPRALLKWILRFVVLWIWVFFMFGWERGLWTISQAENCVLHVTLMPAVFPPVRVWEGADEMRIENITEMRMNYNNLLGMFSN